ncbi:serine hydrolase domain-containing protein [Frigoribacterium sp. 2-23]|uniref:serine hydrolase domain-containing protein n=1 Tax=Frigoribacterium sp. 2-23 TaxID=3415006 RepID=UPI003C6EB3CC
MTRAERLRDLIIRDVESSGFNAHGLHVLVGADTAEHRWTADGRADVHSVGKGVCALALGCAEDDGLISIDAPVAPLFPAVSPGAGTEAVTFRDLITMTSGVDFPWTPTLMTDWPDLAQEFLRRPSRGRSFQYSNASTYTAMRALEAVVGDVGDYVDRRLLNPLGIYNAPWERCPRGSIVAGSGLHLRTEELARIGRLIRDDGRWHGERILAARWPRALHSDWVRAGDSPGYERYAFAGWDGYGHTWRLHGAYGQLVVFSGTTVVTVTAADHDRADRLAEDIAARVTQVKPAS